MLWHNNMGINCIFASRFPHGGRPWQSQNGFFKFNLRDGVPGRDTKPSDGFRPYDSQKFGLRSGSVKSICDRNLSSTESDTSCPPYNIGSDFPPPWVEETDYRQYLGALPDESRSLDNISTPFVGDDQFLQDNPSWDNRNFGVEECTQARENRWRDNDVKRFAEVAQYLDHTALQTLAAPEPVSPFSNYAEESLPPQAPSTSEYKNTYIDQLQSSSRQYAVPPAGRYSAQAPPFQHPPRTEYKYLPTEPLHPAARQYRQQSVSGYLASAQVQQQPPGEYRRNVPVPQPPSGQHRPQSAYNNRPTTENRHVAPPGQQQQHSARQRPQSAVSYSDHSAGFQAPQYRHPEPLARQYCTAYVQTSQLPSRTVNQHRQLSDSSLSELLIETQSNRFAHTNPSVPPIHSQQNYTAPSLQSAFSSKQATRHRASHHVEYTDTSVPPILPNQQNYTAPSLQSGYNSKQTRHRDSTCAVAEYLGKAQQSYGIPPASTRTVDSTPPKQQPKLTEEQQQQLVNQQRREKETSQRRFEAFAHHLENTYPLTGSRIHPPSEEDYRAFADISQFLEDPPLDDLPTANMYHQPNDNAVMLRRAVPVGGALHPSQMSFQQYQQPEEKPTVYRFANSSGVPSHGIVNGGIVNQMAVSEKKELHELNNRLSAVLQNQQPTEGRFDATSLLNAVDSLEQELAHVRTTYEQELGKIRYVHPHFTL